MRNRLVVGGDVIHGDSSGSPPRQAGKAWKTGVWRSLPEEGGGPLLLRQEGFGRVQRGGPLLESIASWLEWDFAEEVDTYTLSESLARVLRVSVLPLPHTCIPPITICIELRDFRCQLKLPN